MAPFNFAKRFRIWTLENYLIILLAKQLLDKKNRWTFAKQFPFHSNSMSLPVCVLPRSGLVWLYTRPGLSIYDLLRLRLREMDPFRGRQRRKLRRWNRFAETRLPLVYK